MLLSITHSAVVTSCILPVYSFTVFSESRPWWSHRNPRIDTGNLLHYFWNSHWLSNVCWHIWSQAV